MVTMKEVKSKSDLNRFIKFGIDLYKGNKYFCPPLIFDEKNTFDRKKNPAYDFSDSVLYLAYKDKQIVGRIAGIINNIANEAWNKKRLSIRMVRFCRRLGGIENTARRRTRLG